MDERTDSSEKELEKSPFSLIELNINNSPKLPRAGRIKEIRLKNFLIHRNIRISLSLNCNLIIGANGSGKSAIASSLAICLGSKGSKSGREASILKDYVRNPPEGGIQTPAIVTIEFDNPAENNYEGSKYGNSIVIERRIDVGGGSRFKFGGEKSKLVSVLKRDIDFYRQHISIDMENVAIYLNQESAKRLVRSSSAADFYKFFEDVLNVEEVARTQRVTWEGIIQANADLQNARMMHNRETAMLNGYREQVNAYEERLVLKEVETRLMNQLIWIEFDQAQAEFSLLLEEKHEKQNERNQMEELIKQIQNELSEFEENECARKAEISTKIEDKKKERMELDDHLKDSIETERNDGLNLLRKLKEQYREAQRELRLLYDKRKEMEEESNINIEPLLIREKELRKNLNEFEEMEKEIENELQGFENAVSNLEEEKQKEIQIEYDDAKEELIELRNQLEHTKNLKCPASFSDRFKERFGYDVERAIQNIRGDQRFSIQPVGPAAKYVYATDDLLSNEKMLVSIEMYLNKYMATWLVASHGDRELLEVHLRNAGCRAPQILVTNWLNDPSPLNVSFTPTKSLTYVIDLLTITDVSVKNFLIDKAFIEATGIFQTSDEMHRGLSNKSLNVMRGIEYTENLYGIRHGGGDGVEIPPPVTLRIGPNNYLIECKGQKSDEFKKQRNIVIRQFNQSIATREQRITTVEEKLKKMKDDEQGLTRRKKQCQEKASTLSHRKRKVESELEQVEMEIRIEDSNRKRLEKQGMETCQMLERKIKEQQEIVQKKRIDLEQHTTEMERVENRIKTMRHQISELDKDIRNLKASSVTSSQPPQLVEIKRLANVRDEIDRQIGRLVVMIEEKKDVVEDKEMEITGLERPNEAYESETPEEIREALDRVVAKLVLGEDLTDEQVRELKMKLASSKESTETCGGNVIRLGHYVDHQKELYEMTATKINDIINTGAANIKLFFDEKMKTISSLQMRMEFEHETKKIHFYVRGSTSPTEMSTLSGGERASVQCGFLMALAESSDAPFHIFDEMDVFMDDETRHCVMKLLFEFAKRNSHRQFIFITPHSEVRNFFENERRKLRNPDFVQILKFD